MRTLRIGNGWLLPAAAILVCAITTSPVNANAAPSTMHTVGGQVAPTLVRDPRVAGLSDNIGLSAAQSERLQRVFTRVDNQIEAALGRHGARALQMRNELQAIADMPAGSTRDRAIRAYQARHDRFYSGLLAESKMDLPALAREMQGIAPEFRFDVKGFTIIGAQVQSGDLKSSLTTPSLRRPSTTTATPTSTRLSGFVDENTRRCSNVAGGDNRFSRNSVSSGSFAAVAGGCTSEAKMYKALDAPRGSGASLGLRYDVKQKAFAVGVVGTSWSIAQIEVRLDQEVIDRHKVNALAPILWVAEAEENKQGVTQNVVVPTGTPSTIFFSTRSDSFAALPAGANGSAAIEGITATLTVTP